MLNLILSLIGIIFTIPASLLRGFAINLYWGWFITSITGHAAPGVLHCTAFYFLWHLIQGMSFKSMADLEETKDRDPKDSLLLTTMNVILSVFLSLSSIFFGWLIHLTIS